MAKEFSELKIIMDAGYTKQEAEEAERNIMGFFATLKKIKDRLNPTSHD